MIKETCTGGDNFKLYGNEEVNYNICFCGDAVYKYICLKIYLPPASSTFHLLEGTYHFKQVKGLTLNGQLAFDKGELAGGDNFGVLLSVKYNGLFDIFKR